MMDIAYISRATVTPLICLFQENENKKAVETIAVQNDILSSITLGFYMNNSALFICDPPRKTHPLFQEMNAQGMSTNVSLNIGGKYFDYSEVESNFVMVDSQEDDYLSVPFSLEIHISNLTGHNRTKDQLHLQDMRVRHDFINVSLQFESQIPFYTRPLGIIWLILISLVFVCGLIFIVYKVKQETLIDYNQETSNIPRLKEEHNISSRTHCQEKNYHMCKLAEQQDTVSK
ncbi:uncharacterized protein LOC142750222 [Rhinoderma darwinii]|uniref:uncharacterized protein LOC142750222 n=1 Tax=Rhinoderma darwinii TaxID=43563 RepID=UPI003F678D89